MAIDLPLAVRPELVEGLSFLSAIEVKKGRASTGSARTVYVFDWSLKQ